MNPLYGLLMLFLTALPVVSPLSTRAAEPPSAPVLLSEINWAGSDLSLADEWIELYNRTDSSMDLSGWILSLGADRGDLLTLPVGTSIDAQSALLVSNYGSESGKTTLLFEPEVVSTALALPNSDLDLVLMNPDGEVIDQIQFSTPEFGSTNPKASMERNLETLNWKTAIESLGLTDGNQFGTPGYIAPVTIDLTVNEASETEPILMSRETCMAQFGLIAPQAIEQFVVAPTIEESTQSVPEPAPTVEEPTVPQPDIIQTAEEESPLPLSFTSGTLLLSELVSDPEDGIEWIEVTNPGSSAVDLSHWSVRDASGKLTTLTGTIAPSAFITLDNPIGKLNNDGDTVDLLDPSQNVIDTITYGNEIPAPKKGTSLVRAVSGWEITHILTKGAINVFDAPENETTYEETSINRDPASNLTVDQPKIVPDASAGQNGSNPPVSKPKTVVDKTTAVTKTTSSPTSVETITGTVTALPGTFGNQIAFVNGIQVYFYHADWPELAIGDNVTIAGSFSESNGERRIKIAKREDITITGHEDLKPTSASAWSATQMRPGTLVSVTASVDAREGEKLTLKDDTGTIIVVAHEKTGISWAGLPAAQVTITGVIRTLGGEARLYPRTPEDISTVSETIPEELAAAPCQESLAGVVKAPNAGPWIGGGLVMASILLISYWYAKQHPALKQKFFFEPLTT